MTRLNYWKFIKSTVKELFLENSKKQVFQRSYIVCADLRKEEDFIIVLGDVITSYSTYIKPNIRTERTLNKDFVKHVYSGGFSRITKKAKEKPNPKEYSFNYTQKKSEVIIQEIFNINNKTSLIFGVYK